MEIVLPSDIKKHIPALERAAANAGMPHETDRALRAVMEYLVPPWSAGLKEEFWVTELGQLIVKAQWAFNQHQAIFLADAARMLFGDAQANSIIYITNHLPVYHRPAATFQRIPKGEKPSRRTRYVLRSDVEREKQRLEEASRAS